jgi:hypothetical protein
MATKFASQHPEKIGDQQLWPGGNSLLHVGIRKKKKKKKKKKNLLASKVLLGVSKEMGNHWTPLCQLDL